ncbi:conserved hypothetical protein [Alteromonas sp. 38]|nr:conserved hypothetical protein [Alteromonas sp. 154]VXB91636.1 conserved hypothetical protein [Alteromonas sp. 38]
MYWRLGSLIAHAPNKKIKSYALRAYWDANTQGCFAIMPYALSPLSGVLGVIYLQL